MTLTEAVGERLAALLPGRPRVLAAVSGGPDSVALAHLLKSLAYPVVIGHVDHQIRRSSCRDALFVEALARRWDVPCRVRRVHVPSRAAAAKIGIEEAAREARYAALLEIARQERCAAVLTGHTADDQAETVFMHFLRGTGLTGLAGMAPVRRLSKGVLLVRPLLDVPRSGIERYLRRHQLLVRTDPSNRDLHFFRNRIRRETLPHLERLVPGFKKRLGQMADVFQEEEAFWTGRTLQVLSKTARKNGKKVIVDLTVFLRYHKALQRRLLRRLAGSLSFQDMERALAFAGSPTVHSFLQLNRRLALLRKGQKLIILDH